MPENKNILQQHSIIEKDVCTTRTLLLVEYIGPSSNKRLELKITVDPEETLVKYIVTCNHFTHTKCNTIAEAILAYNLIP
jgi:hypothetical protein